MELLLSAKKNSNSLESLRENILQLLARYPNEFFKSKEMARRLGIRSEIIYQQFKHALRSLQDEKKILRVQGKKYGHLQEAQLITGTLEVTSRGFGLVTITNGEQIFIRQENLTEATHGDIVEVSIFTQNLKQKERGARREGEVVNIIKRGIQEVVGTLEHVRNHSFVVPDDKRFNREILIPKEELHGATEGDKIVVKIISWGRRYENSKGRVIEILGKAGEMSAEILSVVREFHLPVKFSDEVVMEMNTISSNIPQYEIKHRLDLRDYVVLL